jgi:hypothetical protein
VRLEHAALWGWTLTGSCCQRMADREGGVKLLDPSAGCPPDVCLHHTIHWARACVAPCRCGCLHQQWQWLCWSGGHPLHTCYECGCEGAGGVTAAQPAGALLLSGTSQPCLMVQVRQRAVLPHHTRQASRLLHAPAALCCRAAVVPAHASRAAGSLPRCGRDATPSLRVPAGGGAGSARSAAGTLRARGSSTRRSGVG